MLITDRLQAIDKFYFLSKSSPQKFYINLYKFDNLFGHKSVPNSLGSFEYNIGL